jgi:hypothetical protein
LGFVFRAGPPSCAFPQPLARDVSDVLERHFNFSGDNQYIRLETFISQISPPGLVRKPDNQVFCSEDLPSGGWRALQERASSRLKSSEIRHLLFVDSGMGAYIHGAIEPENIRINQDMTLQVAGLPSLLRELLAYSSVTKLPVEPADLHRFPADPNDWSTLTYIQLMLGAQFALDAGCALWVVA